MKKKFLKILSILFIFSMTFTGCSSFIVEDTIEIEEIIVSPSEDGGTYITIVYKDGMADPQTFLIPKGDKGEDGKSILKIELTSSEGKVDIYTIYYSDGSTSTFSVTNGTDGEQGVKGDDGTSLRTGDGVPNDDLGVNGDSYIDLSTWDLYVKVDGSWILQGSIKGEPGEKGDPGDTGLGIDEIKLTDDGTGFVIYYTDGTYTDPMPLPQPNEWIAEEGDPNKKGRDGKEGDYYFDTVSNEIYLYKNNTWVLLVDFNTIIEDNTYKVEFFINHPDSNEKFDVCYIPKNKNFAVTEGLGILPYPQNEPSGYKFIGWYSTQVYNPGASRFSEFDIVCADMRLYAHWEKL